MIYNNQNYISIKKLLGSGVWDMNAKNNIWLSNKFAGNKNNLQKLMSINNPVYLNNFNFFEESREFFIKRANFFTNQQYNVFVKNLTWNNTSFNGKEIWNNEVTNQWLVVGVFQSNLKFLTLTPLITNKFIDDTNHATNLSHIVDIPHNVILDPHTLNLLTNLDSKTTNFHSWL